MNTLKIDISSCRNVTMLVGKLKDEKVFPDYCGSNWDAFEECLRDFSAETKIRHLVFHNYSQFLYADEYKNKMFEKIILRLNQRSQGRNGLQIELD